MKHILIIEDNTDVRENLEEILELSNFKVTSAANGKLGVQAALNEPPDLILCDVMMPELDGFGVLHILDRNPKTTDIPFIFLTAKTEKEDIRKGMNLGADDYITKPFDDVELLDAIQMRLKKSERLKKSYDGTSQGLNQFFDVSRSFDDMLKLSENREIRRFQKKDVLFSEDQHSRYLYFVNSGVVKTFKTNEFGKELVLDVYRSGQFIGFQSLLKEEKYTESAGVMEDAEISLIPKKDFLELVYSKREVSAYFIKMLSNQVSEKEAQLISLAYDSIRKRVAEALLKLHENNEGKEIGILREDLAAMVGTAKESVIRTLSEFKKDGYITIDKQGIQVKDLKGLEDISW